MMTNSIIGIVGAYVLLAALLLSLNIASLWRWWIKAGAIILTALVFVGSYVAITGLIGWPTTAPMPTRFSLLSTRIVEPDALRDAPGHIYLWIEEIDDRQVVISPPRSFEVPYKVELAADVADAQDQLDAGTDIMGEFAAETSEAADKQSSTSNEQSKELSAPAGGEEQGNATGAAGVIQQLVPAATLTFSDMAPVELPDKAPLLLGN